MAKTKTKTEKKSKPIEKSDDSGKMENIKAKAESIKENANAIIEEIDENETKKTKAFGDPLVYIEE